jgi:general secretion pathway protein G
LLNDWMKIMTPIAGENRNQTGPCENQSAIRNPQSSISRGRNQSGFTLLELVIALGVIAILAAGAIPVARNFIRREKEIELRRNLREIRKAIDAYQLICQQPEIIGPLDRPPPENMCYPESLEVLVEGITVNGQIDRKIRWLRRIPKDPFTGNTDWGTRSVDDEPDSAGGGSNGVFDVYSKSDGKALDGKTMYKDW